MPRTIKDILPPNDYAGRLGLGLVLLVISQWMTKFEGAVFMVLRWVLLIAALANYIIVLILYQEQRKAKKEKEKE
jgi:hypothetical protein